MHACFWTCTAIISKNSLRYFNKDTKDAVAQQEAAATIIKVFGTSPLLGVSPEVMAVSLMCKIHRASMVVCSPAQHRYPTSLTKMKGADRLEDGQYHNAAYLRNMLRVTRICFKLVPLRQCNCYPFRHPPSRTPVLNSNESLSSSP